MMISLVNIALFSQKIKGAHGDDDTTENESN
jgi:hypothetical protein